MPPTTLIPPPTTNPIAVAIIGAGPYGLSLAAHLDAAGLQCRIFGRPMQSWKTMMPAGMKLKSDGFASNFSAGGGRTFTLAQFCTEHGLPYHDTDIPIAVEDFAAYGEEFARRFVPWLEPCDVASVTQEETGYLLKLETGEQLHARNVVVATGLSRYRHIPERYAALPEGTVSHTADHRTYGRFSGQDVVVLGRGASSLNTAALLNEAGARVTLITRKSRIHIHDASPGTGRPMHQRLLHPSSLLGDSMRSWLTSNFPAVFHELPGWLRRAAVYKHLGPAGGSALQGRIFGRFPILSKSHITHIACGEDGRLHLQVNGPNGQRQLDADHIVAGTGYRHDLTRLSFLDPALRDSILREPNGAPRLRRSFESSVKGLYFIGPSGSASFGPLLRFSAGSAFAARQVTRSIAHK